MKNFHQLLAYWRLMRFDRPIGIFLLLWPTLCALWIASDGSPRLQNLVIFILGTVVMRAAGCILNDLADRKIDAQVARTQRRPLVAGEVSIKGALLCLAVLLVVALILVNFLDRLCLWIAVVALVLAIVYPFCKRVTYLPQLVLGFSWYLSIPMAFIAATGALSYPCYVLYFSAVLWTVVFDTQYAMADRADDIQIGVKSTAILFANYDRLAVFLLQSSVLILWLYLGKLLDLSFVYFVACLAIAGLFVFQQYLMKSREPHECFQAFLNNNYVGLCLFLGLFLQALRFP